MGGNESGGGREAGKTGRSLSKMAFKQKEQWSLWSATPFKDSGNTSPKEQGGNAIRKAASASASGIGSSPTAQ